MKKLYWVSAFALLLAGCKTNATAVMPQNFNQETKAGFEDKKYYNAYNHIDKNQIMTEKSYPDLFIDISDEKYIYEDSTYAAIITIDSIDGGLGHSRVNNEKRTPYTYGKFTVLQTIKGDIAPGQYEYEKLCGIVTWDEYKYSLDDDQAAKLERTVQNIPSYVEYTIDIENVVPEPGKTYLALFYDDSDGGEGVYDFRNFGGGLREAQVVGIDKANGNEKVYTVLNNFTKEYEPLWKALGQE